MNKYARFYFDITQNKDIKNTLYDTLTKKEKKNFIRYESKNNEKINFDKDIKLDKFGMKLLELILVLFVPFIVFIIYLFIFYIIQISTNLIPDDDNIITSIGSNPICFIFGMINIYNLYAIIKYYYIKYLKNNNHYYKWIELNYIFDVLVLLNLNAIEENNICINSSEENQICVDSYVNEIRNKINYMIRARYFKLKLLSLSNSRKEIEKHESNLIDKFNTLYIDKEATHLMYGYELMKNIKLINDNESIKDLYEILYEIDDNYIEVNKLLDEHPDTKNNDHLIALIESIKLNKTEIKSFKELVKLIQYKVEFEYYSQKINLLDDAKMKMEEAEKRLNDIYQTVYKLDEEQVNAYDLRIKELEEKVNSLQNQLS